MKKLFTLMSGFVFFLAANRASAKVGLEFETHLNGGRSIAVGGIAGYAASSFGFGGLVGLSVGKHSVIMTGLDLTGDGGSDGNGWKSEGLSFTLPLLMKFYLRPPEPGKVVPSLRIGFAYGRSSVSNEASYANQKWVSHQLQGMGSAGVTYFITKNMGLGMDGGITYSRWLSSDETEYKGWALDLHWQANLTLRL
jgi:hypothetical protein